MTPFLAQLILASFNFAPKGWAQCNGQLMALNQNQALFSLLGTTYGGDGRATFGLPNLQGRTPVSEGNGIVRGQIAGQESHTLIQSEVPQHFHQLTASGASANLGAPSGAIFAATAGGETVYGPFANQVPLNGQSLQSFGGSQAHENRQPYLVLNWCIALTGLFPSQN
jgi:microcystin-dependent protein